MFSEKSLQRQIDGLATLSNSKLPGNFCLSYALAYEFLNGFVLGFLSAAVLSLTILFSLIILKTCSDMISQREDYK